MSEEKVLTKEIAEQFLADPWHIDLDPFTRFEAGAAEILVSHWPTDFLLTRLTSFEGDDDYIEGPSGLELNGLTELTDADACQLSKCNGSSLSLNGLHRISESVLEHLVRFRGHFITLNGLRELSPSTAKAFRSCRARCVELNGLESLSDETAIELGRFRGSLWLNGLKTLSANAAKSIGDRSHELDLYGITELSIETAEILSKSNCLLHVSLDNLEKAVSKILLTHPHVALNK